MTDDKIRELTGGGQFGFVDVMDVSAHSLFDRGQTGEHFFVRPFDDEHDSAVGEILDEAGDVVPHGNVLGGVPKTYTLNAATEMANVTMNGRGFNHRFEHRLAI
jgi:hypothetical protein